MQVRHPAPPQDQQGTEHHKEDEREVEDDDEVSEHGGHRSRLFFPAHAFSSRPPHLTAYTGGRCSAAVCHASPWSTVTHSEPIVVPSASRSPVESISSA